MNDDFISEDQVDGNWKAEIAVEVSNARSGQQGMRIVRHSPSNNSNKVGIFDATGDAFLYGGSSQYLLPDNVRYHDEGVYEISPAGMYSGVYIKKNRPLVLATITGEVVLTTTLSDSVSAWIKLVKLYSDVMICPVSSRTFVLQGQPAITDLDHPALSELHFSFHIGAFIDPEAISDEMYDEFGDDRAFIRVIAGKSGTGTAIVKYELMLQQVHGKYTAGE